MRCPCIYTDFFFGWDLIEKPSQKTFSDNFSYKPSLFRGILYLRRSYESRESVLYNRSRQIDVKCSRG